jgi:hypothetical protein
MDKISWPIEITRMEILEGEAIIEGYLSLAGNYHKSTKKRLVQSSKFNQSLISVFVLSKPRN